MFIYFDLKEIKQIALHEVAHGLTKRDHDYIFGKKAIEIGVDPRNVPTRPTGIPYWKIKKVLYDKKSTT
jgi:hypothetical protein